VPAIIIISLITKVQNDSYNYLCVALIIIFGLGDALDGYIARKHGQITALGSFLDPFADKYLVISCCMLLTYYDKIPFWYLMVIFNKDVIVFAGWVIFFLRSKELLLHSNFFGKSSTLFQIALILLAFLNVDKKIISYAAIVSVVITLSAGAAYISDGIKYYCKLKSAQDK
jgi:cardiolipin synthase